MKITIIGASRGVGRAAVTIAVAGGHEVTAVARTNGYGDGGPVRAVVGNVLDVAVVRDAIGGADAVLVALGTSPSEKGAAAQAQVCSRATATVLAAMERSGPRRIVVVSSYGIGPTRANRPFPFNVIAATLLRDVMADKERQERDVRASSTDWTIAQPLGLTDAAATGTPFVSTDGTHRSSRVSRADVAAVCIDAIAAGRFVRESIAISGLA